MRSRPCRRTVQDWKGTMKNIILLMVCFTYVKCSSFPLKILDAMMKKFMVLNPTILNTSLKTNDKLALLKMLSYNGHTTCFNKSRSHGSQSYVVFSGLQKFKWEIQTDAPVLVVSRFLHENDFSHVNLPLDSEIYFIDEITLKIYETYSINNIQTTRYLGQFQNQDKLDFIASNNFNPSFIKRRGNFHGIQLTAVSELILTETELPKDFESKATYFPNNQTYDVTDIIAGSVIDLLHSLEKFLNFSTRIYKRKDSKWGLSKKLENGTYIINGMLQNIEEGSVDFGCASFSMSASRLRHVDFLPVIAKQYGSIFIPRNLEIQDIDWQLYFRSFSNKLWVALFCTAFIFSVCIYNMEWRILDKKPVCEIFCLFPSIKKVSLNFCFQHFRSIFKSFWTHFMIYFGGKPSPSNISFLQSYKFLVFVSLLGGVVVWISYRAFLTSELSVEVKRYPFHDLASLSKTNYR